LASLGWSPEEPDETASAAVRSRWHALDALHQMALDAGEQGYAEFIDDLLERQSSGDDPVVGSVAIATMHAAKGLEWDAVHIVGLTDGVLPISYATDQLAIEE